MGTHGINYQIDLDPTDFSERTDALFHLGESYPLAHGELDGTRWECRLANCGEQKINVKGERIHPAEIDQYYDTDTKLWDAIDDGEVELLNNSWWEVEFYRVDDDSNWYLDLFPPLDDACIVDNPTDALRYVEFLLQDEPFIKDFRAALKGLRSEEGETDM